MKKPHYVSTVNDMSQKKSAKFSSIRIRVILVYAFLAFMNILFFSALIYENQTDILQENFSLHAKNLIRRLNQEISNLNPQLAEDKKKLIQNLELLEARQFTVFTREGEILYGRPVKKNHNVSAQILQQIQSISQEDSIFVPVYKVAIDKQKFQIHFYSYFKNTDKQLFLHTKIPIHSFRKRLLSLYIQIALGLTWGLLIHFLVALYLYRIIFIRLEILKKTSMEFGAGNYEVRALWKTGRKRDEMDELGNTFNQMAEKVKTNVKKITDLIQTMTGELLIGKEVQSSLLPNESSLKKFNSAVLYRPFREVSGDIYTFHPIDEHRFLFFLADATGHGVPAALITAIILMSVEYILRDEQQPAMILTRLNQVLVERFESNFHSTGCVFLLDHKNNLFTFSNAGHPAPISIDRENHLIFHKPVGPPLGMVDDFEYRDVEVDVAVQRTVFFTDGLLDAIHPESNQYFEAEIIQEILLNHGQEDPSLLINYIEKMINEENYIIKDDLTVICVSGEL